MELPELRYISPGATTPAVTELVSVNLLRQHAGHPGGEAGQYQRAPAGFLSVTWSVIILRASPLAGADGGYVPDPADIAIAATQNWADIDTLHGVLQDIVSRQRLVTHGTPIVISPVTTIGDDGGLVGVTATVAHALTGHGRL